MIFISPGYLYHRSIAGYLHHRDSRFVFILFVISNVHRLRADQQIPEAYGACKNTCRRHDLEIGMAWDGMGWHGMDARNSCCSATRRAQQARCGARARAHVLFARAPQSSIGPMAIGFTSPRPQRIVVTRADAHVDIHVCMQIRAGARAAHRWKAPCRGGQKQHRRVRARLALGRS